MLPLQRLRRAAAMTRNDVFLGHENAIFTFAFRIIKMPRHLSSLLPQLIGVGLYLTRMAKMLMD